MEKERILLVEDEKLTRISLKKALQDCGYEVIEAERGGQGEELFKNESPDLVILDLKLPDINGIEVLERIKEVDSEVPVIIITAYGAVDTAVQAMKLGAFDYITKPFNIENVKLVVEKALETTSLKREVARLREKHKLWFGFDNVIAVSPSMKEILERIKQINQTDSTTTVLLQGESGTGKDLIAKVIHYESPRATGPFVEINCAAIPKELIESELMGYEPGAFTGAKGRKIGLLEQAKGGTLFLDEISEMKPEMQAKFLKIIETKTLRRLGGLKDIKVNVRIIAATNRNLKEEVEKGRFREDLFWRLNVISFTIPPLRERREDIIPLAKHFIDIFSREFHKQVRGLSDEVYDIFLNYDWPGNVRELRNVIERSILLGKGDILTVDTLPQEIKFKKKVEPEEKIPTNLPLSEMEKNMILKALEKSFWNQTKAAKLLGISRDVLRYRMKKYKISPRPEKR